MIDHLFNDNHSLASRPTPPLLEAVKLIHSGKLSAVDYASYFIAVIKEKNPQVAALVAWDEQQVMTQAQAIDKHPVKGPLAGIPIAVKDVIDVRGLPTAYGADEVFHIDAINDANCVALLKEAGAIIVGKAATAEFAFSTPSLARNPHNLAHTPGGSSSGSAAGVAAGMFPLALGTQTGGSVIRPAAFCGVYGFKPTFGLIGRAGVKPFAESFDTIGWYAHSIAELQYLLSILVPTKPRQLNNNKAATLRVGFCPTPFWSQASNAMRQCVEQLAAQLNADELQLPFDLAQVSHCHKQLMGIEMARALHSESIQHSSYFSEALQTLIKKGSACDYEVELQAINYLAKCRALMDQQFQDFDIILTPAAPDSAPSTVAHTGNSIFNRMWSALHVPCVSLPAGVGAQGLPLGVQLVGPRYGDWSLLEHSHAVYKQIG